MTSSLKEFKASPADTRKLIETKGWEQSIAFQTRNPLHRAHEYALVYGAEKILRDNGKQTGVVLNPLVGQLKGDDVPASTRMDTYEALVNGRFFDGIDVPGNPESDSVEAFQVRRGGLR